MIRNSWGLLFIMLFFLWHFCCPLRCIKNICYNWTFEKNLFKLCRKSDISCSRKMHSKSANKGIFLQLHALSVSKKYIIMFICYGYIFYLFSCLPPWKHRSVIVLLNDCLFAFAICSFMISLSLISHILWIINKYWLDELRSIWIN